MHSMKCFLDVFLTSTFSHGEIMDMEIEFLRGNFTEKHPKLLMEHIQRMASGEAPFFSKTLSLVYDKLVEYTSTRPTITDPDLGKSPEIRSQSIAEPASTSQRPHWVVLLKCRKCGERAMSRDLYDGLRCPRCPPRPSGKGRPFMRCPLCKIARITRTDHCVGRSCVAGFM